MEYEITPQKKLTLGLNELWQFRELFYYFTWRDIKVKYKQTVFGFLWAIIQPLVVAFIFTAFMGNIISDNVNLPLPYPIFVLSGMILWNIFSGGLNNAASSMVNNSNIIKKIYFPRLIVPMSSILVSLFDFLMSFIIFIPFTYYFGSGLKITSLLYVPVAIILTVISTFGIGIFISALNVKYRDFRYIVPFFIQTLLFITPIIYPSNITNNYIMKWAITLNPMTAPIEIFRASLTGVLNFNTEFLTSIIISIFMFFFGLYYFRKTEYYFADIV